MSAPAHRIFEQQPEKEDPRRSHSRLSGSHFRSHIASDVIPKWKELPHCFKRFAAVGWGCRGLPFLTSLSSKYLHYEAFLSIMSRWVAYLALLCLALNGSLLYHLETVDAFSPPSLPIRNGAEYASYWDELLLTEYRDKVEELKEKHRTWSRQQLESRGVCVFGASAVPDAELLGEKIVRISRPATTMAWSWRNLFSRGEVLLLTPETHTTGWSKFATKETTPLPKECLVMDVGKNWMTVGVGTSWPAGLWESRKFQYLVRLDRTAPQAPLRAQRAALDRVRRDQGGVIAQLLATTFDPTVDVKTLASQMPSRLNNETINEDIQTALAEALKKTKFRPNDSQRQAIEWALQRQISLIRGPPGTGKTRLASLLVATALELKGRSNTPTRVLAVTHSNGAADVLLQGLLQMGVPAVRLGRPASVGTNVQHRTVLALAEKIPAVVELRQKSRDMDLSSQERSRAVFELRQTMADTQQFIMQTAPVVVTSCISAHQIMLGVSQSDDTDDENYNGVAMKESMADFPVVVLDEAAQTTEPALVCALAAARAEQLILVGDTKQLPPTITCMSLLNSLGVSPMQRLEDCGVGEISLQIQYRMPPALLKHPSEYFYKGLVSCAPWKLRETIAVPAGFPWPSKDPLAFVHVGNGECEVAHGFGGRSNPTECNLVIQIISKLLEAGDVETSQISVISPYSKQIQLIRSELSTSPKYEDIRIGTVDAFQGQETDIVIFSAVRSNTLKEVGFLRDSRRLNVAITRSRRGLILVGDRSTLRSCHHWDSLIGSLEARGCVAEAENLFKPRLVPETSVEDLFSEDDIMKRLFGEEDVTASLLASKTLTSRTYGSIPSRPSSSSALSASFEYEYNAPNPGQLRYITDLPSGFDSDLPAGLRGEAVRSALRSGRGVVWTFDESPSMTTQGLLLIQGKGCIDFLNNKLSNSFHTDGSKTSFREAGLLTARGRLIDRVGVAIVDSQHAWIQTSPGHTAQALLNRWDPFVFPLDEVELRVKNDGIVSFAVASIHRSDVERAFDNYIRPTLGLSSDVKLPANSNECLHLTNDDGSLRLLALPSVNLPSTAAVGYTFYSSESGAWDSLASNTDIRAPVVIGPLEYESLRIQAGYPAYNAEITGHLEKEKEAATPATPMELHMTADLVDTDKGCYMGQEGVASVLKNPRGPPRLLYQVVFSDEFNLYDSETDGEAPSSTTVENLTRLPQPGDNLYVLGSNEEILVGTLTSVAEPGGTGDPETLGLALVRRADSVLQAMKKKELEIPRVYDIAEVDTSSGIIQPPPMDPLDGLEVILHGSFTVGHLRSIPSRRLPPGQNMFADEVPDFVKDLSGPEDGFVDVTRVPLAGGLASGDVYEPRSKADVTKVPPVVQPVEAAWEKADARTVIDNDEVDEAALEEALREAEAAKAAAEAAAAEAERKAAKMEMLRQRAEEAMARRKAKKKESED